MIGGEGKRGEGMKKRDGVCIEAERSFDEVSHPELFKSLAISESPPPNPARLVFHYCVFRVENHGPVRQP